MQVYITENRVMKKFVIAFVLPLTLLLGACAENIGANHYNTSSVGQVNRAARGTVVAVRQVTVSDGDGQIGKLSGAIAGGAAGSMIGGNDAVRVMGGVGGAVLGGIVGDAVQEGVTRQTGYEYTIQLENGGLVTITQGTDILLQPGQRCLVLYGKQAHVVPYNSYY